MPFDFYAYLSLSESLKSHLSMAYGSCRASLFQTQEINLIQWVEMVLLQTLTLYFMLFHDGYQALIFCK